MNKYGFQLKDIDDRAVLLWFYEYQGGWVSYWGGHFRYNGWDTFTERREEPLDSFFAFDPKFDPRLRHKKLASMVDRGLLGGCGCGCRGDFEITDKGLALLGLPRTKPYNGY